MTFKEKLASEHPSFVNDRYIGGAALCPYAWKYESKEDKPCKSFDVTYPSQCKACWERQMPEEVK